MICTVNGISLHVERYGNGPVLLVLHGFTGSMENWRPFVEAWQTSCHVVLVDIIGHGQSDKPADWTRYSMKRAVEDLRGLFAVLQIEKAHVLGYSMGGRLALSFAVAYPNLLESLILESSSPGLDNDIERQERKRRDDLLADRIERIGVPAFVQEWEKNPLFSSQQSLPEEVRLTIRAQRLQNDPIGLANSLRGMGTGAQPSWWEHLAHLEVPVLLATGELDTKFTGIATEVRSRLKDARHITVPECGHAVHVEQSKIFGTIVMEFLNKGGTKRGSGMESGTYI
ncbi:2-succinyl-6-hydroxy-2,4-cyclohexadiene-1-carboxylate synthase [Fodinisporobacter ferrooxydans]|uniref:Putative 2-succinyl-6-hydroxy-2,4-cyclohexadiene-1-carboxylate synthase n=1 Tax=Fodinisporobacter ferrooxydans TaxID=2901836 RepID=A0ABY4CIW5_9BACL|nr:2-succinyl-6-hydroxy-2,4-cyclohexadiene-1-carboxylate synthase [Alicyclobacillaceae bacterium MYW30-H2]